MKPAEGTKSWPLYDVGRGKTFAKRMLRRRHRRHVKHELRTGYDS